MRPYIAIIVDSFREALSSRVLWLLLVIITLILLGLAPLGVSFPIRTALRVDDIRDFSSFTKTLRSVGRADEDAPQRILWDKLSGDLRDDLRATAKAKTRDRRKEFQASRKLISELNDLIDSDEMFTPAQLEKVSFRKEGQEMLDRSDPLSETEKQRLNRLAIESCFSRDLRTAPAQAVQFHYLGFDVGHPQPFSRKELREGVKLTLAGFMNIVAATFGVFISILVTASIIPNMFDVGSVNLLFSKPIVRSLMYLSKFVGGLSFVLINAVYLVVGVWLVVGLRFGVWHEKLLYVIPILMFLFAVYYSVSAFAGMVWRNTIMAVAAAFGLWAVCLAIGWTHNFMDLFGNQPRRVVKATRIGDDVMTVAESGRVHVWSADATSWTPVFASKSITAGPPAFARQNSLLGPIYEVEKDRVLAIDRSFSQSSLLAGYRERDWEREELDAAPSGCILLAREPQGDFLVVERQGISRVVESENKENLPINIFGFEYKVGPKRGSFQPAGPPAFELAARATAAAMNPDDGSIIVYGEGTLNRLVAHANRGDHADERRYEVAGEVELLEKDAEAVVMSTGDWVVVMDATTEVRLLKKESLETVHSFLAMEGTEPRFASAAPGGRFVSVVCHNRRVWVYDLVENRDVSHRVSGQGNITAAEFTGSNTLLVADRVDRVREFDVLDGGMTTDFSPKLGLFDKFFYYVVTPLYRVFPNPGELKDTSDYLLTEKDSVTITENTSLAGSRIQIDAWTPVWKSAGFMITMLVLACVYIHWREF